MTLMKFNPRLKMETKLLSGKKKQTIRKKSYPVGTKLQLWAGWRAQKKGFYCNKCWKRADDSNFEFNWLKCSCGGDLDFYPKKLFDAEVIRCQKIKIKFLNCAVSGIRVMSRNKKGLKGQRSAFIFDDVSKLHFFAKADGFKSNKEVVEFFKKDLKDGKWHTYYIIYWRKKK